MERFYSKDGTQIVYEKLGNGRPLIIIGGSLADHQMYVPLATELSRQFEVFNYDRRNRGKSGTSVNHTIEEELQDIEALISLCNEVPILYGHSAGAALAIRAAAAGFTIHKLILSDLPFTPVTENSKSDAIKFSEDRSRIIELLDQNDKVRAVKFFLKEFGMNEQDLNEFISSKNGRQAVKNSISLRVDYDALGNGLTPVELLKKINVPVLIITSSYGISVAEDVANHLNNCKLAVLEGPTYSLSASDIAKPIVTFIENK